MNDSAIHPLFPMMDAEPVRIRWFDNEEIFYPILACPYVITIGE